MLTYSKVLRREHRKAGWKARLKELNYQEIMPIYRRALDFTRCALKASTEEAQASTVSTNPVREPSTAARIYQPHKHKGIGFEDPRGITYEVQQDGSMRVLNKPRSRVKRLRIARASA